MNINPERWLIIRENDEQIVDYTLSEAEAQRKADRWTAEDCEPYVVAPDYTERNPQAELRGDA